MKLFIVAALIAVASAARLEHLERSYLPPDQGSQYGSGAYNRPQGSFGSGAHGSRVGNNGFGSSFDSNSLGSGRSGLNAGFPATSNQYLPPDHGPSGAGGHGQFSGSLSGFNARSQYQPQQYGSQHGQIGSQGRSPFGQGSQYGSAGSQYGSAGQSNQYPSASSQYPSVSSQYPSVNSQFPSASRQYLAPKNSFENVPQQAFDEQTGYHY